jgi:hypothetical protein
MLEAFEIKGFSGWNAYLGMKKNQRIQYQYRGGIIKGIIDFQPLRWRFYDIF